MKTLFLFLCVCFIPFSQSSITRAAASRLSEPADVFVRLPSEPSILQTSDHGGTIESKYDGFQKATIVTLRKMRISCGGVQGLESTIKDLCTSFSVSLHAPGLQLNHIRSVKVQFIFETKDWDRRHPVDERELIVVADQQTLNWAGWIWSHRP